MLNLLNFSTGSPSASYITMCQMNGTFPMRFWERNFCFCSLEMLARIFALGLFQGQHAYLRNTYNKLDCLIVLASWALKIVKWTGIHQPIYPGTSLFYTRLFIFLISHNDCKPHILSLEIIMWQSKSTQLNFVWRARDSYKDAKFRFWQSLNELIHPKKGLPTKINQSIWEVL